MKKSHASTADRSPHAPNPDSIILSRCSLLRELEDDERKSRPPPSTGRGHTRSNCDEGSETVDFKSTEKSVVQCEDRRPASLEGGESVRHEGLECNKSSTKGPEAGRQKVKRKHYREVRMHEKKNSVHDGLHTHHPHYHQKKENCAVEMQKDDRTVPSLARQLAISSGLATLIPIIFPLAHMLIFLYLWGDMSHHVDRSQCTCSCWDTIFKGPYEAGIAKYKHVYFNCTWNVLKMWTITVFGIIMMYECFKSIFLLLLIGKLRTSMVLLFLSSLHSHYYAWWGHWNYWNDDFYDQWHHQVFFTVSELVASALVIYYLDRRKPLEPLPLLIIANISIFHILSSSRDQFVYTVLRQQGELHQILRDIPLMFTDLVHTAIPFYELRKYLRHKGQTFTTLLTQRKHSLVLAFTTLTMYISVAFFL